MSSIVASTLPVSTNYVLVVKCDGSWMNVNHTTQSIVENYLKDIYKTSQKYLKGDAVTARIGHIVWSVNRSGVSKVSSTSHPTTDYMFCLDRELLSLYNQC